MLHTRPRQVSFKFCHSYADLITSQRCCKKRVDHETPSRRHRSWGAIDPNHLQRSGPIFGSWLPIHNRHPNQNSSPLRFVRLHPISIPGRRASSPTLSRSSSRFVLTAFSQSAFVHCAPGVFDTHPVRHVKRPHELPASVVVSDPRRRVRLRIICAEAWDVYDDFQPLTHISLLLGEHPCGCARFGRPHRPPPSFIAPLPRREQSPSLRLPTCDAAARPVYRPLGCVVG